MDEGRKGGRVSRPAKKRQGLQGAHLIVCGGAGLEMYRDFFSLLGHTLLRLGYRVGERLVAHPGQEPRRHPLCSPTWSAPEAHSVAWRIQRGEMLCLGARARCPHLNLFPSRPFPRTITYARLPMRPRVGPPGNPLCNSRPPVATVSGLTICQDLQAAGAKNGDVRSEAAALYAPNNAHHPPEGTRRSAPPPCLDFLKVLYCQLNKVVHHVDIKTFDDCTKNRTNRRDQN